MKKIFSIFTLLTLLFATSCTKDSKLYSGSAIKHFPETSGTYFVEEGATTPYMLPVGTTISASSDQIMNINIDVDNSTALEGTHFDFVVQSPVLKGGDVLTNIELSGKYDNLDTPQTLKLMVDGDGSMQKDFLLTIQKFCPYIQDDFVGPAVYDGWLGSWGITIDAGSDEFELITNMHGPAGITANEIKMVLNPSDKANFTVTIPKQETFDSAELGLAYGMISMAGTGTFSSCDRVMYIDIEYTVDAGSFGVKPTTITMD